MKFHFSSLVEGKGGWMTDDAAGVLVACHECDRLHRREPVPAGARADCGRCGAMLYRHVPDALDRGIALHLAALILLLIANTWPFLGMKVGGLVQQNHLFSGALALYRMGLGELGLVVSLTSIVFPFLLVGGMLWLLIPARLGFVPWFMGPVYRMVRLLDPWALVGVFLLGALIAIVKLQSMATVIPGVALFAFFGALILISAARAGFDPERLWAVSPHRSPRPEEVPAGAHLLNCHACALLVPECDGHPDCPRCGAALHRRKVNSLARTRALVLSAGLLMIPAQVYPVMTITQFGRGSPDTILSGVVKLIENGMIGLAGIVFFASIVVPVAKLVALVFLVRSVERGSAWRPRDRTLLYRVTEAVGAWSMVDVFLVGLLSGLVSLGVLGTIEPEIGASFFGAVVILTMFAAHSFDPRLIWDRAGAGPIPPSAGDPPGAVTA
jgi:paraquat-inducible protein A